MTIREAIRAERETMKDKTFKEKLSYFWEYNGVKTICVIIAVIALVSLVATMVTQKEYAYMGVFFGATIESSADDYINAFAQAAGIDTNIYDVTVQANLDIDINASITEYSYQATQSFNALLAARMVDNIAANVDLYLHYSYLGYTVDLRTVLTQEELSVLEPYLYYIDGQVLQEIEESDTGLSEFPDPKQPESMADPIPVGIDISAAAQAFRDSYTFRRDTVVIGICTASERESTALAYLKYAFGLPLEQAS